MTSAKGLGDIIEPYTRLKDIRDGAVRYAETSRSQLVEYASLFCLKTDIEGNIIEDTSDLTETQIIEKFNDWKEIPMNDFFLLVMKAIPGYIENYKNFQNQSEALNGTK